MNWSCSPAKASWMSRNFEKAAGINCGIRADRIMQIESGAPEAPWDAPGNAPGVPGGFLGERVGWEPPACYKSLQCPPSSLTAPDRNCCVVTQTCSPMPLGFETLSSLRRDSAGVDDAGGISAISRWLSEARAIPPVTRFHIPCTLARVPATYPHASTPCRGAIHITLCSGGVAALNHRLMAENPPGFVRWPVYHRVRIQFRRDDSRPSITGAKPRVWNRSTSSNPSAIGL